MAKQKIHPDSTLADRCRAAGVRVRLLWEIPGPENTQIAWLSCYAVGPSMCIVETFAKGGWNVMTPIMESNMDAAVTDVMDRCAVSVAT